MNHGRQPEVECFRFWRQDAGKAFTPAMKVGVGWVDCDLNVPLLVTCTAEKKGLSKKLKVILGLYSRGDIIGPPHNPELPVSRLSKARNTKLADFTVVFLVAWPLSGSEAGVDSLMPAGSFTYQRQPWYVSKQGALFRLGARARPLRKYVVHTPWCPRGNRLLVRLVRVRHFVLCIAGRHGEKARELKKIRDFCSGTKKSYF